MLQNGGSQLIKIAVLENAIEAQLIGSILDSQEIPHRLRSFCDTAYDGLFQMQMGWNKSNASQSHKLEILQIIEAVRLNHYINDSDEIKQVLNTKKRRLRYG